MLTKLNRSDEAEAIYRRAIDMFPNAPAKGEKLRRVSERDLVRICPTTLICP